jgi:hypothetical protein
MKLKPNPISTRPGFSFAFDSGACSTCPAKCCRGSSGYVFLGQSNIDALAAFLELEREELIARFLRKVGTRFALQEIELEKDDFACTFLDAEKGHCTVYEVRPAQCRTFPFWEHFRLNPREVDEECPGIIKEDQ